MTFAFSSVFLLLPLPPPTYNVDQKLSNSPRTSFTSPQSFHLLCRHYTSTSYTGHPATNTPHTDNAAILNKLPHGVKQLHFILLHCHENCHLRPAQLFSVKSMQFHFFRISCWCPLSRMIVFTEFTVYFVNTITGPLANVGMRLQNVDCKNHRLYKIHR